MGQIGRSVNDIKFPLPISFEIQCYTIMLTEINVKKFPNSHLFSFFHSGEDL